jgi:flagellar capping protein FliD
MGDAIISSLTSGIRGLAQYEAQSGVFTNLTALGMTFDDEGKLAFSSSAFDTAVQGQTAGLLTFLESFTGAGDDVIKSLAGATGGAIATAVETVEASIAGQEDRIEAERERISLFEETLLTKINQADALIAALEQKVTYVTGMFESMRAASKMYS